jgi:exodeoxyribonuclease V beta subunit
VLEKTIQLPPLLPHEFPRGSTAGSALHEVFENLDFTQPVKDQQESIATSLSKWGFNQDHLEAASLLMENCLQFPIASHLSLSALSNKDRLNEMEFHLPLASLDLSRLKQTLLKHLPNDDDWQPVRESVDTLHFDRVKGYLKGFIDLIFIHNNQYYIADYKSNSLLDYEPNHLLPVIADAHYYLQYLLYSVALHRYLRSRISTYDWDTHVGGVYYLFIRGMSGSNSSYSGVFFDKPSLSLIEALDELFMGSSENV